MKFKLNATEYAALSDELKKLYIADGDEFRLQVEGMEDTGALKRAKDHEKAERQKAEKRVRELTEEMEAKARGNGDVKTLEDSWKQKLADKDKEHKLEVAKLRGQLETILVDNVADGLAKELSTAPSLLKPVIRARLRAEEQDGNLVTRVLDGEGKPSALNLDDLKKEVIGNKEFAAILIGSKGSGSGAAGNQRPGASGTKAFKEMNEAERTALYNSDPAAYDRLAGGM